MRLVFAGTPEPAVVALEKLIASRHEVVGVLTRPDARVGRGRSLRPSPVKAVAEKHGIEVLTPNSLKPGTEDGQQVRQWLSGLAPDAIPVVAYGNLISPDLLGIAAHGWVNLHFSLLPAWRGAAPVQAAIAAGDTRTGATTFRIDEGLDTGDVLATLEEDIQPTDTADDLLTRLAYAGADLLVETMDGLEDGAITPRAQDEEGASYAPKIQKEDAHIDWSRSAADVDRQIRAYTPGPGAWTLACGKRFKVGPLAAVEDVPADAAHDLRPSGLRPGELDIGKHGVWVGTATTAVRLAWIQPPGKKMMNAADWARGFNPAQLSQGADADDSDNERLVFQ